MSTALETHRDAATTRRFSRRQRGRTRLLSACLCLSLVSAVACADTAYKDTGYPLTLAIPDDYTVERKQLDSGVNLFINDQSSDGFCTVTFIPAPRFEGTQAEFDTLAQPRLATLVDDSRSDHSLGKVTPFVLGDAKGVVFEATTDKSSDESKLRFLFVYLEARNGHAQFVCATAKEAFTEAKPTFERLFRSIRLP